MRVASWFIIVAPIFGLWMEGHVSFLIALLLGISVWCWCFAMMSGRDPHRTPIDTIFCRIVLTAWIPFGTFMWWVQADGGVPRIFTFWEACYASFVGVIFFVGISWGLAAIARRGFGDSDPQLIAWEHQRHYFWDMLPWPWNPDGH